MSADVSLAAEILERSCAGRVRRDLPLAPLTTFRIGGPASLYLEPEDERDLRAAAEATAASGIDTVVIGKGSNILVSDEGFPGLVLRLGRGFRWTAREGRLLTAGGATPVPALAGVALGHRLSGLEFGVAIPATLGGAIRMNAGAHGREMAEVVDAIDVFRLGTGRSERLAGTGAGFAYRRTDLGEDAIVIGATLRLAPGEPADIRAAMHEARAWRRATQPLAEPNCGSVFVNPPGHAAARLIEESGAKGMRVGGAQISAKHANFIVAGPGTRAADVAALMGRVREVVRDRTSIELHPEVQLIGRFADAGR